MKFLGKSFLVVAFMVSLLFMAGNAGAFTFYLTEGNVAGTGEPDGLSIYEPTVFARVDVGLIGSNSANITFTAMNNFLFWDSKIVNVNVAATDLSVDLLDFTGLSLMSTGQQADGFGKFNVSLAYAPTGGTSNATLSQVNFVINSDTANWSDAKDVLTATNSGYLAAAHMAFTDNTGTTTGFAGGDGTITTVPAPVPIPPTVWLLGAGLVGLWGVRRRFSKK